MGNPLLYEALTLLREYESNQSETEDCANKKLAEVIRYLEELLHERYSEQELATILLEQLGLLFDEVPEIQDYINSRLVL